MGGGVHLVSAQKVYQFEHLCIMYTYATQFKTC